jgi:hypothetical protein
MREIEEEKKVKNTSLTMEIDIVQCARVYMALEIVKHYRVQ